MNEDNEGVAQGACPHGKTDGNCGEADWEHACEVCGEKPVVCCTGLCGPCTFGEGDTAGGNW